jgi:CheY-like chemotaxis protein
MISSIRGELCISVTDSGVGIDARDLATLFEPFSQADGSMSRKVGGTGLGLTISRRLAQLMGGELKVESERGVGSTFTLFAPVEDSDAVSTEMPSRLLHVRARRHHRILLAEDNEVNRLIVGEQIQHLGFGVVTAANGVEVLQLLADETVDLILMDCQMPELDGYETTRRLRAKEAEAGAERLPVIALTAHAFEGERDRCLAAGMDDYLSKPFRSDQLSELIDIWLARSA